MDLPVEIEGSGPPMVLIPGFACAPNVWFKVRESLARDFELHMITVPGFGGTPGVDPPVLPKLRDAIGEYCAALGDPVLLGHSLGGTLTLWIAARRFAIRAAVVVDGLPYFPTVFDIDATPESMKDRAEALRDEISAEPASPKAGPTYFDQHIIDPKDAAFMNETTPKSDSKAMGNIAYEQFTTDFRSELHNIGVPTLIIGAGQPWIKSPDDVKGFVDWSRTRMGNIPDVELVVAERARHFIMIDDPDWFLETVKAFVAGAARQR